MSRHGNTWLGGKNSPREMRADAGPDMLVESSGNINNVRYSIGGMEWQSGEACRTREMNQKYWQGNGLTRNNVYTRAHYKHINIIYTI